MNAAWGIGHVLGGAGGGALADSLGDVTAFAVLSALCLAVAGILVRARTRQRQASPEAVAS
jgi:predicted MFS family arabinose efflux permease